MSIAKSVRLTWTAVVAHSLRLGGLCGIIIMANGAVEFCQFNVFCHCALNLPLFAPFVFQSLIHIFTNDPQITLNMTSVIRYHISSILSLTHSSLSNPASSLAVLCPSPLILQQKPDRTKAGMKSVGFSSPAGAPR